MAQEPSHVQLTEISRETIPTLNWMMEDLFCRYGVSIPYFMLDFSFADYSDRPDWITYTPPDWYLPEWKAMWPTYPSQLGFPEFSGFNFNIKYQPWDYWLVWFNELLGLLFDVAHLPRWQMPDLSPASIDMLNTQISQLYETSTFAKRYTWTQNDAGGILQLWTGILTPAGGFTASKRTSGTDYENIQDMGMCLYAGKVYMAYGHTEYFVGEQELWTAVMNENGTNFTETKRRTFPSAKSWATQHVQIHALDSTIYIAWLEQEAVTFRAQVFTATMDLDGSNWSATQRTTDATTKYDIDMQIYNNKIYILYLDFSGNCRINLGFMDLDGSNWTILERYTYTGATAGHAPKMHIVDDVVYIFWAETSSDYHYDYLYLATRNAGYERLTITSKSAVFTVGETITGDSSGATATIKVDADTYLDVSERSATAFTDGEEIEGGTSESTAIMVSSDEGGWNKATLDTIDHWAYHDPVSMTWTSYHTMYVQGNFVYLVWMQFQGTYPDQVYALWTGRCNTDKTGFTSTRREYNAAKTYYTLEMKVRNNLIYYVTRYGTTSDWLQGPVCTATMDTDGTNFTLTARTNTSGKRDDVNMVI